MAFELQNYVTLDSVVKCFFLNEVGYTKNEAKD